MTTFTVLRFADPDGARKAEGVLAGLQAQDAVAVLDAAVLTWPEGKPRPRTRPSQSLACLAVVSSAYWGLLFGLVFFLPHLRADEHSAPPPRFDLEEIGVDSDFVATLRTEITCGTSALFVFTDASLSDTVYSAFSEQKPFLAHIGLTAEQTALMRRVFG